jgi:CRP-like cAMP-binding protein
MAYEDVLGNTDFFRDAPASVLSALGAAASEKNLTRGDVLFEEGAEPDAIYVVLAGRIAIAIGNKPLDNRESVVALMDKGDLFGGIAHSELGRVAHSARQPRAHVERGAPARSASPRHGRSVV